MINAKSEGLSNQFHGELAVVTNYCNHSCSEIGLKFR